MAPFSYHQQMMDFSVYWLLSLYCNLIVLLLVYVIICKLEISKEIELIGEIER